MSLQSHIIELERKHGMLEEKLHAQILRPAEDTAEILELKRKKLKIKDELTRLKPQDSTATV